MRVYFDNRGRVRGYSLGLFGYYLLVRFIIMPIALIIIAAILGSTIGVAASHMLGRPGAVQWWRGVRAHNRRLLARLFGWYGP